jgi:hypothetical protein
MSRPAEPNHAWPPWVQNWVLPYLQDRALWPVAFALLGHVVVVLAPLMIWGARTLNPFPIMALALMLVASVHASIIERRALGRSGVVAVALTLLWAVSVGVAVLTDRTGIF